MYICVCKAVTDAQILTAIEQGLCSRKKLTHCFGIGRDCGKCNQDVNMLLMKSAEKRQQPPLQTNHFFKILATNNV